MNRNKPIYTEVLATIEAEERMGAWIPDILAGAATFGLISGFWTAGWWLGPLLNALNH